MGFFSEENFKCIISDKDLALGMRPKVEIHSDIIAKLVKEGEEVINNIVGYRLIIELQPHIDKQIIENQKSCYVSFAVGGHILIVLGFEMFIFVMLKGYLLFLWRKRLLLLLLSHV